MRKVAETKMKQIEFKMQIEPHQPENTKNPCNECVLNAGWFFCLDRSYCEFKKTGKTWKKVLPKGE